MNSENVLPNIIRLLQEQNRKQKELADYLGLNESAVANWKAGTTKSYQRYLARIANFFNVSVSELMETPPYEPVEYIELQELQKNRSSNEHISASLTYDSQIFPHEIQELYNNLSLRSKLEVQTFIVDQSEKEKNL